MRNRVEERKRFGPFYNIPGLKYARRLPQHYPLSRSRVYLHNRLNGGGDTAGVTRLVSSR